MRHLRRRYSIVCAAVASAALAVAGCHESAGQREPPDGKLANTQTIEAPAGPDLAAVRVELPKGWHTARASLTPRLVNPVEVLSVGTFPMHPTQGSCANFPARSYREMGAKDAIVTFMQQIRHHKRFSGRPGDAKDARFSRGRLECVPYNLVGSEVVFHVAAGDFYAFIVLGKKASPRAAIKIVRSFRAHVA